MITLNKIYSRLLLTWLLLPALTPFAHGETRLNVKGNLKGFSEHMENTCTEDEAHILGLSQSTCSKEKDGAIKYCAKVVGKGLGRTITFNQFEQILVPRLNYCIFMRRAGLDAGEEAAEKMRILINYQRHRYIEKSAANISVKRDAPKAARPLP